jgi:hypothetical protein
MSASDKDTVYIDVDDEITSIIDKVVSSKERIVALVLPKRAAVLQSIVNMKLLKRAADEKKKRLVLITSETALMPLAGAAGLHVAKTLQSRPTIPISGVIDDSTEELNEGDSVSFADQAVSATGSGLDDIDDFDSDAAGTTSIGELAGPAAATPLALAAADDFETIELDDAGNEENGAEAIAAADSPKNQKKDKKNNKAKKNKDKNLAVPNFNRFRMMLILGFLGVVGLGVLLFVCLAVLPKATITINTDTSDIKLSSLLSLDPKATSVSKDGGVVPAGFQEKQQSSSQQVASTGQQNNGQTAHGSATIALNNCNVDQVTIPAGTGLSTNGLTYITQSAVSLTSIKVGGKCNPSNFSNVYSQSVNVVAQKAGAQFNIDDGTKLSVASAGDGSYSSSDLSAKANGTIGGGTDNIVKVVAQADIDGARAKLASQDSTAAKTTLSQALVQAGYRALDVTFSAGTPAVSPSAAVGTASDTVTVTQVVTYSMYGVKDSDVTQFVTARVNKQIDPTKQTILNDGVSSAEYKLTSTTPEQVTAQTTSVAGPDIKPDTVKSQVAGKKSGEITTMLKLDPGVTDVKVKFSPFWVSSAPKSKNKITVVFVKSQSSSTNGTHP